MTESFVKPSRSDRRLAHAENTALHKLFEAYSELKRLGWNDIIYCPKDGTHFDAIEIGSTGVHDTYYEGEWPSGHWWIAEAGDLWPSHPAMFRVRSGQP